MSSFKLAVLSFLMPLALATPALASQENTTYPDYVHPANGDCVDYAIDNTISFPSQEWIAPKWKSDYDVAAYLFNQSSRDSAALLHVLDGKPRNVTASYKVSATFCSPKTTNGKEDTVLVATHGGGYDRRYWASSYQPDKYNFAQAALNEGYSIFYYDRLGLGMSSRVNGFEIQAAAEVASLAYMIKSIRGSLYTGTIKTRRVVLVGHSFGSFISNGMMASNPELADAAVLTGMAYRAENDPATTFANYIGSYFGARIASLLPAASKPQFADTFDNGYTSFGDMFRHIECFFHQPNYDVDAAKYAQSISQPSSVSEQATILALNLTAADFKGPVMITSGEYDLLVCQGNCTAAYAMGTQDQYFPAATPAPEVYVHPGAGHGVNFGHNATGLYQHIFKWLEANIK